MISARARRLIADVFPLTGAGALLAAASLVAALHFGVARQDRVLGAVGLAGGVLVIGALVLVMGSALWVWWAASRGPSPRLTAVTGVPARTGFGVDVPTLPFLTLRWTWDAPQAEVEVVPGWLRAEERVVFQRHGEHHHIRRRFDVRDPFGLCQVGFTVTEEHPCRVLPDVGRLGALQVVQGLRAGDGLPHPEGGPEGDLLDLRPYAPGDPIRQVLWKVYARTGELIVRTPERALSPVRDTLAYLVASEGDEAAAGLARVLAQAAGVDGTFTLGADGVRATAGTPQQALELVLAEGAVSPESGGLGLAAFLAEQGRGRPRGAMVLVGGRPGPWVDRVRDAALRSGMPLEVLIVVDGLAPRRASAWWQRAAPPVDPTRPSREDVDAVVRALSSVASKITLVDRRTGAMAPAGLLRRTG